MIKYGLKNIYYKIFDVHLISIFLAFITGSVFAALSASKQVSDGYNKLTKYYDIVIGPKGSSSDIIFSNLTFSTIPENTFSMEVFDELHAFNKIPIAVGDSYNDGSLIVGTYNGFFSNYKIEQGKVFTSEEDVFDIVIGCNVADKNNLHIGSKIVASHDATESHAENPYTVVGILEPTSTNIDNTCFTYINNIWDMHSHEEENEHTESEDDEHKHESENNLTGILIKTSSIQENLNLVAKYKDNEEVSIVTINLIIRNLLSSTETTLALISLLVGMIAIIGTAAIIILINNYRLGLLEDIKAIKAVRKNPFSYILIQIFVIILIGLILSLFCRYLILLKIAGIMKENGLIIQTLFWR